jgi:hypothetical protein
MIGSLAVVRHPVQNLFVARHRRPGRNLAAVEGRKGRLRQDVPGTADRLDPLAAILRGGEVVEAQRRMPASGRPI